MNHTTHKNGTSVIAVGAPGSIARMKCEGRYMEFAALCGKYNILPALALESQEIRNALSVDDLKEVERVLLEEF